MLALSDAEHARAWRAGYRFSIDQLADSEIAWERDRWRELGASKVAVICDDVLWERADYALAVSGGAAVPDLDALWRRVDQRKAVACVEEEAMSLVGALRLGFWFDRKGRTA